MIATLLVAVALADDAADARAKDLFRRGEQLFDAGQYQEAATAWEEGYRLSKRPLFLYNIAVCYDELGFLEEALETYRKWRAFAPAEELTELDAHVAELEARIAAMEAGEVWAGDVDVPRPGRELPGGDLDLDRPVGPTTEKRRLPVAPLAMIGGGATSLAVGFVFGAQATAARAEARAYCAPDTGRAWCTPEARPLLTRAGTSAAVADALGLAGVGLAATGAVLWVRADRLGGLAVAPAPGGLVILGTLP